MSTTRALDDNNPAQNAAEGLSESSDIQKPDPEDFRGHSVIKEGLARILVPSESPESQDETAKSHGKGPPQSVFYNPIQQFNRDLSVIAIQAFGQDYLAARPGKKKFKPLQGKKRKRDAESDDKLRPTRNPATSHRIEDTKGVVGDNQTNSHPEEFKPNAEFGEDETNGGAPDIQSRLPAAQEDASKPYAESQGEPDFRPRFRILDALSATGLRALRYSHEISFVTSVTANDVSLRATEAISANVRHNKLEDKIEVTTENAMSHMYSCSDSSIKQSKYHVIDLDPYGTAAPFLDASMQAIADGGLLCVTCTDAGVWASCGHVDKTYALYGGTPIKGIYSHEGGLRLILHAIASTAARYGMSIEPLMSLSIDFYARVFVRIHKAPNEVKLLAGKTMLVYSCDAGCGAWNTQLLAQNKPFVAKDGNTLFKFSLALGPTASPFCEHCGMKTHMSGPMWAGPLHNPAFLEAILGILPGLDRSIYATKDRVEGMVSTALEETLVNDDAPASNGNDEEAPKTERLVPRMDATKIDPHPFFFIPSVVSKVIHCQAPSEAIVKGALRFAGFIASRSHARPGSIRTNAPWSFIWKLMLEWTSKKAPIREGAVRKGTAGWQIVRKYSKPQSAAKEEVDAPDVKEEDESKVDDGESESRADGDAEDAFPIVFDEALGREVNKKKLLRYQINPRANWGPMSRAKGSKVQERVKQTPKDARAA